MRPRDGGARPVMVLAGAALLALGILIMLVFVVRPLLTMDDQPSLSTSTTAMAPRGRSSVKRRSFCAK